MKSRRYVLAGFLVALLPTVYLVPVKATAGPTTFSFTKPFHYTSIRPAANFNPLTAMDAELRANGLPSRPSNGNDAGWVNAMKHLKTYVVPKLTPTGVRPQTNTNTWSGYLAGSLNGVNQGYTQVSGQWIVPSVSGQSGDYSCSWVGLGGMNISQLIQDGTEQDTTSTGTRYYSWICELPDMTGSSSTNIAVSPGDLVYAQCSYDPSNQDAYYFIENVTTGKYTNPNIQLPGSNDYSGASAEWITERPLLGGPNGTPSYLADYGTNTFEYCDTLKNGVKTPLASDSYTPIYMNDGHPLSSPGPLSSSDDGTFTDTFKASN